jgi:GTP-binding protein Era
VVIDKFEVEGTMRHIAVTIIVERDGHKGMINWRQRDLKQTHRHLKARQGAGRALGLQGVSGLWVKVR